MKQGDLLAPPPGAEPARNLKPATLVTDGACLGNPGPGGWACILRYKDQTKEIFGSQPHTTNNRMELTAVIEGLRALKQPCRVRILTDSQYVMKGVTEWMPRWKRRGWRTATGAPVLNRELWTALDEELDRHTPDWEWVKGHADHQDNNRCDELASRAAQFQTSGKA